MLTTECNKATEISLSEADFRRLRDWIHRETGIYLGESKQTMLKSRLVRRLASLQLDSFRDYFHYLSEQDSRGMEREQLINCITTNKTDFFRENHHFKFLREKIFPMLQQRAAAGGPKKLRIWSAACSTGEEPYSIAMTVREHFGSYSDWDLRILATDIDTRVLAHAECGIYDEDRVEEIPKAIRNRYFRKRTREQETSYQVTDELRSLITFRSLNFMEPNWPINAKFDCIFCRNVIIYFNAETQDNLMRRLHGYLHPHGHMILGHSESLLRLNDYYASLGQTIYSVQPGSYRAPSAPETSPRVAPGLPSSSIIVGEVHASGSPSSVRTVLGSCIAVCLFDPKTRIGGMNHFMLPSGSQNARANCTSYGMYAMDSLINELMARGADRGRLVAKVFGGASVLPNMTNQDVGLKNIEFIKSYLETEKIPVVAKMVGGCRGMQVCFETHTGKARVRLLDPQDSVRAEKKQCDQFAVWEKQVSQSSTVTLF